MEEIIAAIATPAGAGGIAVIRISGEGAAELADKVFSGSVKLSECASHTVHYGFIKNESGEKIDEALATVMRAPRTFTREDVVEISTHGGMSAPRAALDAIIHAGARMAEPGEFTKRAFLNGRIDLSQAEAVIDIINSTNTLARRNAFSQLEGSLSAEISALRAELIRLAARMQVIIDYPDEDLEDITPEEIKNILLDCKNRTDALLAGSDSGRIVRDGVKTVIAGKPNVGKSSLLNALARSDRAIVTDVAGTTRDVIEEYINLDGIPLSLCDTAGIRSAEDEIEKIGVERSRRSIEGADLVLVVLDASAEPDSEDYEALGAVKEQNCIVIANKSDIGGFTDSIRAVAGDMPVISVSAKNRDGLDALTEEIKRIYKTAMNISPDISVVTNMRHKTALIKAGEAVGSAYETMLAGMPSDMASIDINIAIDALGEITGESVSDAVVTEIFHNFCVGK